jgi:hypothetical protein
MISRMGPWVAISRANCMPSTANADRRARTAARAGRRSARRSPRWLLASPTNPRSRTGAPRGSRRTAALPGSRRQRVAASRRRAGLAGRRGCVVAEPDQHRRCAVGVVESVARRRACRPARGRQMAAGRQRDRRLRRRGAHKRRGRARNSPLDVPPSRAFAAGTDRVPRRVSDMPAIRRIASRGMRSGAVCPSPSLTAPQRVSQPQPLRRPRQQRRPGPATEVVRIVVELRRRSSGLTVRR